MTGGSVIGAASTIRGDIRGTGSLEVAGRVDGNIHVTGDVVLAEGCHVEGSVRATHLRVQGRVDGDLIGEQALEVHAPAVISGELLSPRLSIEAGAELDGKVRTKTKSEDALGLAAEVVSDKGPASPGDEARPEAAQHARDESKRNKAGKKKHKPPPEPVVPTLKKGAKGKKRKQRE